jgi:hypothetical protein
MIMGRLQWAAIAIVVIGMSLVIAYWRGWVGGANYERQKWEVKTAQMHANAVRQQNEWRVRSDKLSMELINANTQIDSMAVKIRDLLTTRVSASRQCFSADVTRMLNTISPIRETVTPVAGTDAAPAAAAADSGGSSERAVAVALVEARTGYEKCRTQLHKLIDWVEEVTQ